MQSYLARQPIFDRDQNVYAYELLFRAGEDNQFPETADGDYASSSIISDSVFHLGLENITDGKKAFINFTRQLLLEDHATMLPKETVVVEILETVDPQPDVVEACKQLKAEGYTIALDDFAGDERYAPFLEISDIIKVDMTLATIDDMNIIADQFLPQGKKLLAEKVETPEQFQIVYDMGYHYFQGYFFSKPHIIEHRRIPESKVAQIQLLKEVNKATLDVPALANIIKCDVSLSYKLLRYINSSSFGLRNEISSIQHAINMLGIKNIRKWSSLIILSDLGGDKPTELINCALTRARLCEQLAAHTGHKDDEHDLFLMGLLSLLDAMTDQSLADVLSDIPISDTIKDALINQEGELYTIFEVAVSYEQANWAKLFELREKLGLDVDTIPQAYMEAIEWVHKMSTGQA